MHPRKYLAVSLPVKGFVTVRNSGSLQTGVTRYAFPHHFENFIKYPKWWGMNVRTFLIPHQIMVGDVTIRYLQRKCYRTCYFFASVIHCLCECRVKLTFNRNQHTCRKRPPSGGFLFLPQVGELGIGTQAQGRSTTVRGGPEEFFSRKISVGFVCPVSQS